MTNEAYWAPHVTVAAIIEQESRFLFVEELIGGQRVFNQPAGHIEPGESLIDAVIRETLEETGYAFNPTGLVGIYQYRSKASGEEFLRFAFGGAAEAIEPRPALDTDILATHWLSPAALNALPAQQLRSPLVALGLADYIRGQRFPLSMLQTF